MWGIFFGEFQCLPFDDCSAVSCDSGALARGSESTSFYSAILNQSDLSIFWLGCLFVVVFFMLSCMSRLYIVDINPLSVMLIVNIFFHSVGYLFAFLMVSFVVQKLWSFIRSHLFIFVFVFFALGDRSKKKILLQFISGFCLCFPLGVYIICSLTYRTLIHFEFILYMV